MRKWEKEILSVMRDGRERTTSDLELKIPAAGRRSLNRAAAHLVETGRLTVDHPVEVIAVYKIAKRKGVNA